MGKKTKVGQEGIVGIFTKSRSNMGRLNWTDVGHLGPEVLGTSVLPDFDS